MTDSKSPHRVVGYLMALGAGATWGTTGPLSTGLYQLMPDLTAISQIQARGVIVTSKADSTSAYDFVSRFFAPQSGVPEDPVTGSAHCALAPYWSAKLAKQELRAYQASARGGELMLRLVGDRVRIGGQAVTVLRGELTAGNMAS